MSPRACELSIALIERRATTPSRRIGRVVAEVSGGATAPPARGGIRLVCRDVTLAAVAAAVAELPADLGLDGVRAVVRGLCVAAATRIARHGDREACGPIRASAAPAPQ